MKCSGELAHAVAAGAAIACIAGIGGMTKLPAITTASRGDDTTVVDSPPAAVGRKTVATRATKIGAAATASRYRIGAVPPVSGNDRAAICQVAEISHTIATCPTIAE